MILSNVMNIVEKFIPDKTERDKLETELNKNRLISFDKLIEKGGIPAIIWLYFILVLNNQLIVPWTTAIFKLQIFVVPIPPELTNMVTTIVLGLLGKKHLDKRVKK